MAEETTNVLDRIRMYRDNLTQRQKYGAAAALVAVLLLVPFVITDDFVLNTLIFLYLFAMMGSGWNVIGGYAGQVSFGHALLFAMGAYGVAVPWAFYGLTPLVGIWIGGLVATAVGLVTGAILFRLRYHYFAMGTLAAALVAREFFFRWDFVNASQGIEYPFRQIGTLYTLAFREETPYYFLVGAFALATILLIYKMDRSKLGLYLKAINMDQEAAENAGINSFKYKMYAMGISSFITGMGGALYAQYVLYIDPMSTLQLLRNVEIMIVAVIGGVGTVLGPLVGAAIFIPIREYTRTAFGGVASGIGWVVMGVILALLSMYRPGGVINEQDESWWR